MPAAAQPDCSPLIAPITPQARWRIPQRIPLWAGILIGGYLLAEPGMAAREASATAVLQQTQAAAVAVAGV